MHRSAKLAAVSSRITIWAHLQSFRIDCHHGKHRLDTSLKDIVIAESRHTLHYSILCTRRSRPSSRGCPLHHGLRGDGANKWFSVSMADFDIFAGQCNTVQTCRKDVFHLCMISVSNFRRRSPELQTLLPPIPFTISCVLHLLRYKYAAVVSTS